jgi:hypothetical protein
MFKKIINKFKLKPFSIIFILFLFIINFSFSTNISQMDLFIKDFNYNSSNGIFTMLVMNNGTFNSFIIPFEITGSDKENINIYNYEFVLDPIGNNSQIYYSNKIDSNLTQLLIKLDSENLNDEFCEENNIYYYPGNLSGNCKEIDKSDSYYNVQEKNNSNFQQSSSANNKKNNKNIDNNIKKDNLIGFNIKKNISNNLNSFKNNSQIIKKSFNQTKNNNNTNIIMDNYSSNHLDNKEDIKNTIDIIEQSNSLFSSKIFVIVIVFIIIIFGFFFKLNI